MTQEDDAVDDQPDARVTDAGKHSPVQSACHEARQTVRVIVLYLYQCSPHSQPKDIPTESARDSEGHQVVDDVQLGFASAYATECSSRELAETAGCPEATSEHVIHAVRDS
jgi:hypothetical protein